MKKTLAVLFLAVASIGTAQTTIWQVPVWSGRSYTFPRLGPGLTITNGVLDVVPQTIPVPVRVYNYVPAPDPSGAFIVPPGAVNVVVYLNGLRQAPGIDYNIVGNVLTPVNWKWNESVVLFDYESNVTLR